MSTSTPRPQIHFTPERHWMNDPNGLVLHDGRYHLYYQHNPGGTGHGDIGWGHASSTDLVAWTHHPLAIAADGDGQIFSGSAVLDVANTSGLGTGENPPLVAIYTLAAPGSQSQAIASSTDGGLTWLKHRGNPVLDRGTSDFRDPKVFRYEDEHSSYWVMVAVEAQDRQVLLHRSDDLITWQHLSTFGPRGPVGGVWECPDLVRLPVEGTGEHRWVLLISLNPGGVAGGSGTHYLVGDFDGTTFAPDRLHDAAARDDAGAWPAQTPEELAQLDWLDHGRDCYAGVTFSGPLDEPVLMAWMSNWDYASAVPTSPWVGAMTLPRRLSLVTVEGRPQLRQRVVEPPLHPVTAPAAGALAFGPLELGVLPPSGRLRLRAGTAEPGGSLRLLLRDTTGPLAVDLVWSPSDRELLVHRTDSAGDTVSADYPSTQRAPLPDADGSLVLDVWFDTTSLEVVACDGLRTITEQIFLDPASRTATLVASGAVDLAELVLERAAV